MKETTKMSRAVSQLEHMKDFPRRFSAYTPTPASKTY